MSKITVIELPHGKRRFMVKFKKERLGTFSTEALANECAAMYLVPPYTMNENRWHE